MGTIERIREIREELKALRQNRYDSSSGVKINELQEELTRNMRALKEKNSRQG